jgi:hypothetical protein
MNDKQEKIKRVYDYNKHKKSIKYFLLNFYKRFYFCFFKRIKLFCIYKILLFFKSFFNNFKYLISFGKTISW